MMYGNETQLQQMITGLRTRLLIMCAAVGISLDEACAAFHSGNMGRAVAVIDGDEAIDRLETEIDELALSLLARNQPVAQDLRFVVSALRMVGDLERIGDEAVNIAERAVLLQGPPPCFVFDAVNAFMDSAKRLFADSVEIFRTEDWRAALALRRGQDETMQREMTALYKLMDAIAAEATGETRSLQGYYAGMHGILICRALNRICGRSANIAEHAYFTARGVNIKHRREDMPAENSGG
jgi:phosphate transport system protein